MNRRRFLQGIGCASTAAAGVAQSRPADGAKTLRIVFEIAETGFDPVQVQDQYSRTVTSHIFDAPLEYDYLARPVQLRPNTLAAMPEVSADFRSFIFRVQPGILFQDDPAFKGRPRELMAADYVYAFKRFYDPRWKSPQLFTLEPAQILGMSELRKAALAGRRFNYDIEVEGLRALDRYTFQIKLAAPSPRFLYLLADNSQMGAIAREVVERYGDDIPAHPVGTGPFRLTSWTRGSRIVLERSPNYRARFYDCEAPADAPQLAAQIAPLKGRRLPLVDRVEVSIVMEDQPRWLAFLRGDFDWMRLPREMQTIAAPGGRPAPYLAQRGVRLPRTAMSDVSLTYFNMEDPVVGGYTPEKVALRRAVSLAFDRPDYERAIFDHQAITAQSPIAPGSFGYDPTMRTAIGETNLARARALLDLYGYVDRDGDGWRERPDGRPLVLELAASPSHIDRKQNEQWRRYMSSLGVRMTFRINQWGELLKQSLAGKLMMWGFSWQLTEPDSDLLFAIAYGPNREQSNDARFALAAYDRIYEQQRRLPDGPERLALLREGTRLLAAYMPYMFHLHRLQIDAEQPWLIGRMRHPFTERHWHLVDVDPAARFA